MRHNGPSPASNSLPPFASFALALIFLALVTLVLSAPAAAVTYDRAPVLDPPEENSLPIGMTPEEEANWDKVGTYRRDTPPPVGPGIRQCAEWEPVTGALVRYPFGLPAGVLREIAEEIELWVTVANQTEQNSCTSTLQGYGVNMANVRFVTSGTNSIWTRDYGPQFMFDANGDQGIVDHHYNRPRPLDDQVNYTVGAVWGLPVYGSPVIHTGGNFMCDGHGNGFSTRLVYDENSLPDPTVDAYMQSYLGISPYHVIQDIATGGIHHIDCWAKLLDERTLLVKQVATNHPDYARIEQNVATFRTYTNAYGEPYNIVRVFCGAYSGDVAAYTNSIILNNKVIVPTFGLSGDAAALQAYRDAMPGYEVLGFTGSWLTDDAIHCRAMGIHDKYMLRVDVAPLPDTVAVPGDIRLGAVVDDRSETGLKADSVRVYWRVAGAPSFQSVGMTASAYPDSFYGYIPIQPPGTEIEYYVFAADNTNRRSTRPPSAPAGSYSFVVGLTPAGAPDFAAVHEFGITSQWPNPFQIRAEINFRLPTAGPARMTVLDVQGRQVAQLVNGTLEAGAHTVRWDGRDPQGKEVAGGIYFVRLSAGERTDVKRIVRLP